MAENRARQQLGSYRLVHLLGEGGFAEVYLGEHISLKTQAAIKILHTRLGADDLDGFVSEAQTIARLKHHHIVRVLDFGVDGSIPFLVMDYAPNGTLRQRHRKGTRLEPAVIVPYVKHVAEALQYAHEQKLVHRDVKPENMLIGDHDEVVLSDFGIATVAQSSRYQGTQEVAGTVAYMAPEQVQGKPRPASDQYSLGIVVYEWLTSERPFHGSFTEIATQHVLTPPPPLREKVPNIAPAVEEVVLTALAKDPKERFASVRAFATAFERACQDAALHFAPTQVITTSGPIARPTAVITPAGAPASGYTPTPDLPPTIAVPPSRAPAETGAAASITTPLSWPHVPQPASTAPATVTSTPPSTPRSNASVFVPPVKDTAKSKRRSIRPYIIFGSLILIMILLASAAVALQSFISSNNTPSFHQEVTTGNDITSIQVGTGIDPSSGAIQGETDTFHVGDTVYVRCIAQGPYQFCGTDLSGAVTNILFQNGVGIPSDIVYSGDGNYVLGFYATVTDTGVYKWVLYYHGVAEARITFQVVS